MLALVFSFPSTVPSTSSSSSRVRGIVVVIASLRLLRLLLDHRLTLLHSPIPAQEKKRMVMILSERASTEQHRLLLVLSCVPIEWMIRNDRPFCHHL